MTEPSHSPAPGGASGRTRPSLVLSRLFGRNVDLQMQSVLLLSACAFLVAGLQIVHDSTRWGFTYTGAWNGILSQLSVTGPAAVLMAAATTANILAGAVVVRWLGAPAYTRLSDVVLAGFAGAVVGDAAVLFVLGSGGFFGWPELLALHLIVAAVYLLTRRRRPLMAGPLRIGFSRPVAWWPIVLAIWAGPLIVQLASPVVPFMDVLPNHVAPVQHIHLFGSFDMLNTSPSPIYGPSRLMLGYVALLGQLATITNLDAALAEAAFALPLAIVIAVSLRRLVGQLLGGSAGFWILLTFPLTFTFMRIPDARGTVVVFPLAAWALTLIAQELHARRAAARDGGTKVAEDGGAPDRPGHLAAVPMALAIGGAFLLHPLVGLVAATAAGAVLLLYPMSLARRLVPALGGAALLALPQVLTMAGRTTPSWVGALFVASAICATYLVSIAVDWVMDRIPGEWFGEASRRAADAGRFGLVVMVIAAGLIVARLSLDPPDDPAGEALTDFIRITWLTIIGAGLTLGGLGQRLGRGWIILGCGIAAGILAWAASSLVGTSNLTEQAIHYEVPKSVEYWLPVMFAIGAAGSIAAVLRRRSLGFARIVAVAVFLLITIYPLPNGLIPDQVTLGPVSFDPDPLVGAPLQKDIQIGEHRGAESLGLAFREAEQGYWVGPYPDPRTIVGPDQQAVIDAIRAEERAGRLGPKTVVLHIASSFQQWVSVPIGVFTGAIEDSISLQPEVSIHTDGGRLYGFADLPRELAARPGYVVIEPGGLPPDVVTNTVTQVEDAGYHKIWENGIAVIYARN